MTDERFVVVDLAQLWSFVETGHARRALEAEVDVVGHHLARLAGHDLQPTGPPSGDVVERLSGLLVEMERVEFWVAAIAEGVTAADRRIGELASAPAPLIDSWIGGASSGALWDHDPEIAAAAAATGLSFEQAYVAVRTQQIDLLTDLLRRWPVIDGGGPQWWSSLSRRQAMADRTALLTDLALGDEALVAVLIDLLDDPSADRTTAEAIGEAAFVLYDDASIDEVLAVIDARTRWWSEPVFDPFLVGAGAVLMAKVEAFTGADAAEVDPVVAGSAQARGVSYNEMVVLLGDAQRRGNLPRSAEGAEVELPPLLVVDVSGPGEAAALLSDHDLFTELDTASQAPPDPGSDSRRADGRFDRHDLAAVVDRPERFSPHAVLVARYLLSHPDDFGVLDTARDGTYLSALGQGRYHGAGGDGTVSFADIGEYRVNSWLFDVLQADLSNLDRDGDRVLTEDEFRSRLDDVDLPDDVRLAVDHALANDLVGGGDQRPGWRRFGSSLFRMSSIVPNTPQWHWRLATDPGGLASDTWSAIAGAGGTAIGVGQLMYDVGSAAEASPLYHLELWRVDGDLDRHRGVRLVQAIPELYDAAASLVPGTDRWDEAIDHALYYGTWDHHPGIGLARSVVDLETFYDDPGRWIGSLAPDVLVVGLAGGGGLITRSLTTADRLEDAGRRLLTRVSQTGVQATLADGFDLIGLQGVPRLLADDATRALTGFEARMHAYAELWRVRRSTIDFTQPWDGFGLSIARRVDVDPNGFVDVVAHGNPSEIAIDGWFVRRPTGPSEALERLLHHPSGRVQPGQPIRLLSCSVGCDVSGFARDLAVLGRMDVLAPTDILWADQLGRHLVSAPTRTRIPGPNLPRWLPERWWQPRMIEVPVHPPTGGWRLFHPDGTYSPADHTGRPLFP